MKLLPYQLSAKQFTGLLCIYDMQIGKEYISHYNEFSHILVFVTVTTKLSCYIGIWISQKNICLSMKDLNHF